MIEIVLYTHFANIADGLLQIRTFFVKLTKINTYRPKMQHTAVPNANVLLEIRIFLRTVDVREGASSDSCASCRERC